MLKTTLLMVSVAVLVCGLLFAADNLLRFESSPNWKFSTVAIGPQKIFPTEQVGKLPELLSESDGVHSRQGQ
jgi:hypothetical protein